MKTGNASVYSSKSVQVSLAPSEVLIPLTHGPNVLSTSVTVQAIQDFIRLGIGAGYTNCTLSSGPTVSHPTWPFPPVCFCFLLPEFNCCLDLQPPPTDLQPDGDNELYVYFAVGKPHNSTKCRKPKKHLKSGEGSA